MKWGSFTLDKLWLVPSLHPKCGFGHVESALFENVNHIE